MILNIFSYIFHLTSFLVKHVVRSFAHFLKSDVIVLVLLSPINMLSQICNYFHLVCALSFLSVNGAFHREKILILDQFSFINYFLNGPCVFSVI